MQVWVEWLPDRLDGGHALAFKDIRFLTRTLDDLPGSKAYVLVFVNTSCPLVKRYLLTEGCDPKYGARHLKRAIERHVVFPLANLVATGQVKLGDFVRIDMNAEGQMVFVKEAEGALVPVLLEKYGPDFAVSAAGAKAGRGGTGRREATTGSILDHK